MKKILIVLGIALVFTVQAFAQSLPNSAISFWSVKKWSTGGIYQTDSDFVRATHVFNLKRSMLSVQYSPLGSRTGNDFTRALEGHFGVAINEDMYFAATVAWDSKLNYSKNSTTKTAKDDTLLVVRPVFRINNMVAIEYMFGMDGSYNNAAGAYTNANRQAHRLAVGIMIPNAGRLSIPVTLALTKSGTDADGSYTTKKMRLDIEPEFWIPFTDKGPLGGINFALFYNMDLQNKTAGIDGKDPSRMGGRFEMYPSLKWTFSEGRIGFGTDPKLRIDLEVSKSGRTTALPDNEVTVTTIKPALLVPFGTFFKIGEYVELRGGFEYNLTYTHAMTSVKNGGVTTKSNTDSLLSTMAVYTGLGVNIGTDGSLDFMLRILLPNESNSSRNFFSLDSFGIQGTYRF